MPTNDTCSSVFCHFTWEYHCIQNITISYEFQYSNLATKI